MKGPLEGMTGLVLTQAWAGSFCTQLLGFLGADVIQVEVRKRPDSWRGAYDAPMPLRLEGVPTAKRPWNCNPLYNSVNLQKRCLTLDISEPEGLDLFLGLVPRADFVAENFSPRVLGNLGIGYERLRQAKPDIIVCSLSAYGHDGPWANIPGIGGTIEPTSGMSALLGYPDGPPLNSGQMYPDAVAAFNGAAAIVTALRHRQTSGDGQFIDLSMQEANLAFVGDAALEEAILGRQRPRTGNRDHDYAPHGIFRCSGADHWIAIACEDDAQWAALCRIASADWDRDTRFMSNEKRKANEAELEAAINEWCGGQDRDELVMNLTVAGAIAAPVLGGDEVAHDRGLRDRNVVVDISHPEAGVWPQVGSPFHFSDTPGPSPRAAPLLGEHSFEILESYLGVDPTRFDELSAEGISGEGPPPGV